MRDQHARISYRQEGGAKQHTRGVAQQMPWRESDIRTISYCNSLQDGLMLGNGQVHGFRGLIAFLRHAPKKSSASRMEGPKGISREIANVASMHVKMSDPVFF